MGEVCYTHQSVPIKDGRCSECDRSLWHRLFGRNHWPYPGRRWFGR